MTCDKHNDHDHKHGSNCGHKAIHHEGHVDYLHDNHLHNVHDGHIDEHKLAEDAPNQSKCTPDHLCSGHDKNHKHKPGCGHEAVPHGSHVDFLVAGHLHHPCENHCDDHGQVAAA